ncbi:MAG: hypothetical protein ACRCXL_08125 [Dermatophilaceae bacterium]
MTRLTESVFAVTRARAIDGLEEDRWTGGDIIAYARTLSGNEIDLAPVRIPTSAGVVTSVPVEAKWVDQGWRSDPATTKRPDRRCRWSGLFALSQHSARPKGFEPLTF